MYYSMPSEAPITLSQYNPKLMSVQLAATLLTLLSVLDECIYVLDAFGRAIAFPSATHIILMIGPSCPQVFTT